MTLPADAPIPEDIPCTTAFDIPGYKIVAHMGLTWGVLVRSVGFTKGFAGNLRALQAGEVPQYTDVVDKARRQALARLIQHAQSIGGNAVIGVRFDSSDVGGSDVGLSEIIAYGSAVVITPIEPAS
jgi:uncharacterized protein YbjQ (UPF0145 family)